MAWVGPAQRGPCAPLSPPLLGRVINGRSDNFGIVDENQIPSMGVEGLGGFGGRDLNFDCRGVESDPLFFSVSLCPETTFSIYKQRRAANDKKWLDGE